MKTIRSSEQEPNAKIADFALARQTLQGGTSKMTMGVGTWRWMAPEVFIGDGQNYDTRVDVFSFGMLVYEMLARKLPYHEQFPPDQADPRVGLLICRGVRPEIEAGAGHP